MNGVYVLIKNWNCCAGIVAWPKAGHGFRIGTAHEITYGHWSDRGRVYFDSNFYPIKALGVPAMPSDAPYNIDPGFEAEWAVQHMLQVYCVVLPVFCYALLLPGFELSNDPEWIKVRMESRHYAAPYQQGGSTHERV